MRQKPLWQPIVRQIALLLILLVGAQVQANQLLTIEVTSSQTSAIPIAIPQFANSVGRAKQDIAAIIQEDLARSGEFKPLKRDRMLSRPSSKEDVVLRDWRVLSMDYVLVGNITGEGDRITVNFDLVNIETGKTLKLAQRAVSGKNWRALAHTISDLIYEKLLDKKGFFSTEVLYISQDRSKQGNVYELQKADADGYGATTLLRSKEPIMSPSWAPDGQHIAYVSYESSRPAIYVHNVITGEKRQVTKFSGINGAPDWSPDGRYLAMTLSKDGNPEIYLLELQSGRFTRLTKHYAIDTEPRWAPDGKSIIFTSSRGGSPQIYQLDMSSRKVKRLTFEGDYNARGTITPDGEHLVMVHRESGSFHIAVQDLKYGQMRVVTKTALDESPTLAPNGQMIMFATEENNRGMLSMVSLDGRTQVRLPSRTGEVREPAWSPFLR